jgi:hypothetical protein
MYQGVVKAATGQYENFLIDWKGVKS